MSEAREYVEDGGLISCRPNPIEITRRSTLLVDKVLKGAKPADLPIEQPTKLELVINLKDSEGAQPPDAAFTARDKLPELSEPARDGLVYTQKLRELVAQLCFTRRLLLESLLKCGHRVFKFIKHCAELISQPFYAPAIRADALFKDREGFAQVGHRYFPRPRS